VTRSETSSLPVLTKSATASSAPLKALAIAFSILIRPH